MAKDPAMLWYWSDWFSGTSLMTRHLKGCYMDVLHAQFNNGRLSLEEIKITLGSDFGSVWPTLQKKFKTDDSGLFFNERLEIEKEKRKAYVASRSHDNAGRKKSYDKSNENGTNIRTENENRNENIYSNKTKKVPEKKFLLGEFMNVKLKESEIEKLHQDIGEEDALACIEYLSRYKQEKGYKTKDDNLTIRRWVISAVNDKKLKVVNNGSKNGNQNNTHDKLRAAHSEAQRLLAEDLAEYDDQGEGSD